MLKRKFRVHAKTRLVNPLVSNSPLFILRAAKNNLGFNRYCFVVSKKVDARAVARNRIRRVAATYIQSVFDKIQPGYDFLFYFHKPAVEQESQIAEEMKKIIDKLKQ